MLNAFEAPRPEMISLGVVCTEELCAYPKVNFQVATASKLPVPNLECDGHFVILVQDLMEAFSRMRAHLDVVGEGDPQQAGQSGAGGGEGEAHRDENSLPEAISSMSKSRSRGLQAPLRGICRGEGGESGQQEMWSYSVLTRKGRIAKSPTQIKADVWCNSWQARYGDQKATVAMVGKCDDRTDQVSRVAYREPTRSHRQLDGCSGLKLVV